MCPSEQEPRHLQYVADLEGLNVYSVVNSRKLYGAPTDFTFCIRVGTSENLGGKSVCLVGIMLKMVGEEAYRKRLWKERSQTGNS